MTEKESFRLNELRTIAQSNWGHLMSKEMVIELRQLEHKVAIEFAKKHGLTLHC